MQAGRIQSGKCYLHHHGEFDWVCRRPIYKQYRRTRCFSFPSSLKCPFCRQFLRVLFDRLFSLAVIILSSWYIMQLSLRMCASDVSHFSETRSRRFVQFFLASHDPLCLVSLLCWFPKLQYSSHLLSIRARKCERCWQSLVSSPTYLGAFDFLKFDISVQKQMRFKFSRLTNHKVARKKLALRISWEKYSERTRALRDVTFTFTSCFYYSLTLCILSRCCKFLGKKNGATFFLTICWLHLRIGRKISDHLGKRDRYYYDPCEKCVVSSRMRPKLLFVSESFISRFIGIRRILRVCKPRVWKSEHLCLISLISLILLFLLSRFLIPSRTSKNTVVHSVGIPPPS